MPTNNEANLNAIGAVMDNLGTENGVMVIIQLMAGPEHWKGLPTLGLSVEAARAAATIYRLLKEHGLEQEAPKSFLASQAYLAHHAINSLVSEMEMWAAENGRDDILSTPVQLINAALPEDERIEE